MHLRTIFGAWLVVALAVLWTCAASASASVAITSEEIYTGPIKAESSNVELDGTVNVKCGNSTIEGEIESHGPEAWVSGPISGLAFSSCGKDTVTVAKSGVFTLSDTGTLRSTGAEFTVQLHRTIFGFPITTHCIYKTSNTQLGTLTGSKTTGSEAVVDIESATIPQSVTDGACGEVATLTGTYKVTTPATLDLVVPTTTLCKEQPKNEGGKLKCPAGQSYGGEIIAELTGPGTLKALKLGGLEGTITCEKIEIEGKFSKNGQPEGGVSKFTLTSKMGVACSSNLFEEPPVTVTMQELAYNDSQFLYWAGRSDNGTFSIGKEPVKEGVPMWLEFGGKTCKYLPLVGRRVSGSILNGAGATPAVIDFKSSWSEKTGTKGCPPEVDWDFKLNLLRPGTPKGNLYLASE